MMRGPAGSAQLTRTRVAKWSHSQNNEERGQHEACTGLPAQLQLHATYHWPGTVPGREGFNATDIANCRQRCKALRQTAHKPRQAREKAR